MSSKAPTKTRLYHLHTSSIRTRLLGVFVLSVVVMGLVGLLPIFWYRMPISQYNAIITAIENENKVLTLTSEIENMLQNSILISSNEILVNLESNYSNKINEINESLKVIEANITTEELRKIFEVNKILVKRFQDTCDEIIRMKGTGFSSVSTLTEKLNDASDIGGFIEDNFRLFVEKDIEYYGTVKTRIVSMTQTSFYISVGVLAVVLSFCLTMGVLIVRRTIINPVNKLQTLMKQAEGGDLEVLFEGERNDEINQLGNSFNSMIAEIKNLIHLVYTEQKSNRNAELRILQAQIKPHFLYNTLETILAIAEEHGEDEIVEIVCALTVFFRLSLSKGKPTQAVGEELEHVNSYLIVQKVRYKNRFDYTISCDDHILCNKVLKMTLQPIVENAIYHGVKQKPGKGLIQIEAREKNGMLYMKVADNGIGIPKEKVDILNQNLIQGINNTGYGVYNVNERIKLSFSSKYGVHFKSVYGEGTTVEIWHPLITNEQVENV